MDKEDNLRKKSYYTEIVTTTYEKVMGILYKVSKKLSLLNDIDLIDEIKYVIQKIESKSLYSYSQEDDTNIKHSNSQDQHSQEVKNILNEYSELSFAKKIKKENIFTKAIKKIGVFDKSKLSSNKTSKSLFFQAIEEKINDFEKEEKENENKKEVEGEGDGYNKEKDKDEKHKNFGFLRKAKTLKAENRTDKINEISPSILVQYKEILDKNFNIFDFFHNNGNDSFGIVFKIILSKSNCDKIIDCSKLDSFLYDLFNGYNPNPQYHNFIHGADVCHGLYIYWNYSNDFETKLKFSKLNVLTMFLSGICHDVGHPGLNNNYHINSYSNYALTYNDKSVLESYHASESSKILLKPSNNILHRLEKSEFKGFRRHFIEAILSTDMTFHARTNSILKSRLTKLDIIKGENIENLIPNDYEESFEIIQEVLNFLLHLSDLGNGSRKFDIYEMWVFNLCQEFWDQGDLEKSNGLPVSYLCDRQDVNVPISQIGFLKGIIIPSFKIILDMFPELGFLMENVEKNLEIWQEKEKKKEKNFSEEYKTFIETRKKMRISKIVIEEKEIQIKSNKKISFNIESLREYDSLKAESSEKKIYNINYNLINVDDEAVLE